MDRMREARECIEAHERLESDRMGRHMLDAAILHLNDEFWGMGETKPGWDTHALATAILKLSECKGALR
jgi:hypothetical protein